MKDHKTEYPSDGEMEILQVLWGKGPLTVRDIHGELMSRKQVGQTTVLKQVQRMEEKGYVARIESQQPQKFEALLPESETKKGLVDKMLGLVFKGSAMDLVMHALGGRKPSLQEAKALREWLDNELNKDSGHENV